MGTLVRLPPMKCNRSHLFMWMATSIFGNLFLNELRRLALWLRILRKTIPWVSTYWMRCVIRISHFLSTCHWSTFLHHFFIINPKLGAKVRFFCEEQSLLFVQPSNQSPQTASDGAVCLAKNS